MILTIRTDAPVAEIGLYDEQGKILYQEQWEAARRLHNELVPHIELLLAQHQHSWSNIAGIVVFQGPGSFTGLRLGVTAANTIAYAQHVPVIGAIGQDWIRAGIKRLAAGQNDTQVLPHYGREPNITKPSA